MVCSTHGLENTNTKTNTYNDKYRTNRHTYDVICFWKGDDKRSLILQNMQVMPNMQNTDYADYAENAEVTLLPPSSRSSIISPPSPPSPLSTLSGSRFNLVDLSRTIGSCSYIAFVCVEGDDLLQGHAMYDEYQSYNEHPSYDGYPS